MPLKFASLGALMAVAMLAGCSTTSSESAKDPVATDAGHSRCEAKAAEFAIGKRLRRNCSIRLVPRPARKTPASSSQPT